MNNVCILTPSYDGKFSMQYVIGISEYYSCDDINFSLKFWSGDTLLSRARSILLSIFYESLSTNNFSHLLWLDSDVYIPLSGIRSMINRNKDIVSAGIPIKKKPDEYGTPISVNNVLEKESENFYKVAGASTGALLMKTESVKKIVEYSIKNDLFFYEPLINGVLHDLFRVGKNEDGWFLSEDLYFCHFLNKAGLEIYLDTSFTVEHCGQPSISFIRNPSEINPGIINEGVPVEINKDKIKNFWVPF
jgi:hypothetical protein